MIGVCLAESALRIAVLRRQAGVQTQIECRRSTQLFTDCFARKYLFHQEANSARLVQLGELGPHGVELEPAVA